MVISPSVSDWRVLLPTPLVSACCISGRSRWFSISPASASLSKSTLPSWAMWVMRPSGWVAAERGKVRAALHGRGDHVGLVVQLALCAAW